MASEGGGHALSSNKWVLITVGAAAVGLVAVASSSSGRTFLRSLWFGDPAAAERKHADAVFSVVADNISSLSQRIAAVRSRAVSAYVLEPERAVRDGTESTADGAPGGKSLVGSRADGYYYFSSDGKRLKTKWDNFDIDAELERLDDPLSVSQTAPSGEDARSNTTTGRLPSGLAAAECRPASLDLIVVKSFKTEAGVIGKLAETCLEDLDEAKGSGVTAAQKRTRKALVSRLHDILKRVDDVCAAVDTILLKE